MKEQKTIGYLQINSKPTLWKIPFDNSFEKYSFPKFLIKKYDLKNGMRISCRVCDGKVISLDKVHQFNKKTPLDKLISIIPENKLNLNQSESADLKIIDFAAPLAKGSRAMIISPPRAGKTTILENIAKELPKLHPNLQVIAFLIDERPEEITSFKMNTNIDVFHSSLDQSNSSHIRLCDFLIDHIRSELEWGKDIVILMDSLTRLTRAFNRAGSRQSSQTMSGGLDARALLIPRKLFGLARAIKQGGSCTILATILHETGSRMDEIIFQEFKGTGNCEIFLDRAMADERIFPAINIRKSGTRNEEILRKEKEMENNLILRRKLLKMDSANAINYLKEHL